MLKKNLFKIIVTFFIFNVQSHIEFTNKLRIISFNLNRKLKHKEIRSQICRLLKEFNADIICLQEANKVYVRHLAKELNLYWHKDARHIGGMTILSKHTILQALTIEIPNSDYNAVVAIKIEPNIWITSVHLDPSNYLIDDSKRIEELNFIFDKLDKLNADKIIIAGDFNSLENSEVSNLLTKYNYIDTHKNKPWQCGTWMPAINERIDRIHCRGNFRVLNGKVVDHNDIEWLKKIGWPTGNDHRLVITDLLY